MAKISGFNREDADVTRAEANVTLSAPEAWFVREVLPLEAALIQFLQHNWRNQGDIADLRQDVYVQVFEAAKKQIPEQPKAFVFQTARNLLIDRVRREQIVPIEAVADAEALSVAVDAPGPERSVIARDELRRLQLALDRLPPRCREIVVLGRIQGLSGREIAVRLGITPAAVSIQLANGIKVLVEVLYGGSVPRSGDPL